MNDIKKSANSKRKSEDRIRLTIYLPKLLLKKFKHRAVDEEKELSELAEEVFQSFLESDP